MEYIEATAADIAAANALAAVVLGRCLDDLPPQTRTLLGLLDGFVSERCRADGVGRGEVRFTRREVREASGWGDTQLKLHLKRLAELELVGVHRNRQTGGHTYELLYACDGAAGMALPDLLDVGDLDLAGPECDVLWSGVEPGQAASGRGVGGTGSGDGRGEEPAATPGHSGGNDTPGGEGMRTVDMADV